jgi:hypothetical protein
MSAAPPQAKRSPAPLQASWTTWPTACDKPRIHAISAEHTGLSSAPP